MKVSVNCKCEDKLFELNPTQEKVIMNDVFSDIFDRDMKRRLHYILMHKYEECFKRLKEEWEPKLKEAGVDSIPLNNDKFAELVFSQPDYKDRAARDPHSQRPV